MDPSNEKGKVDVQRGNGIGDGIPHTVHGLDKSRAISQLRQHGDEDGRKDGPFGRPAAQKDIQKGNQDDEQHEEQGPGQAGGLQEIRTFNGQNGIQVGPGKQVHKLRHNKHQDNIAGQAFHAFLHEFQHIVLLFDSPGTLAVKVPGNGKQEE